LLELPVVAGVRQVDYGSDDRRCIKLYWLDVHLVCGSGN
jgi:hypothetical protein